MDWVNNFLSTIISNAGVYVPRIILGIVVLIVGLWLIKRVVKSLKRQMAHKEVDESVQSFLGSLIGMLLKAMLLISVASMFGIKVTSFVAIIGAAGLAVGLALQGSLANFAGGVLILLFKPFKVGDFIEAQGYLGSVSKILIFTTMLKTPDNKTVIIPNGPLSNGSITNYSTEANRRVDMTFGIGYGDDIQKARGVIKSIIDADSRILKDPPPDILVSELADSSVNFAVRVWCAVADYWGVYFDMHEKVKLGFDANSVSIPFPQVDVHTNKG
ncbi:mechanosensitive ion channel [bacterium]|nr:mechanosensitive ion channel [bacterium]